MKIKFWVIIAIIAFLGFGTTSCGGGSDDPQYRLGDTGLAIQALGAV